MADGIYVALSGAIAQSASLDATAANLANASTDGYQRIRPVFREELSRATSKEPALHYTSTGGTQLDTTRGSLRATGRSLDFAMPQGTYLALATAGGERYTRAASLSVGHDGTLITSAGVPVSGEDGKPIKLSGDTTNVRVDDSGQVRQGDAVAARVKLVSFATPANLVHESGALLAANPQSGTPSPSSGKLDVGQIEESNTSVVGAMTDLVSASRTFEAFQRVIDTFRDTDRQTVTTVPSVQ
jgi:flagellar basal body rod protein FlgG